MDEGLTGARAMARRNIGVYGGTVVVVGEVFRLSDDVHGDNALLRTGAARLVSPESVTVDCPQCPRAFLSAVDLRLHEARFHSAEAEAREEEQRRRAEAEAAMRQAYTHVTVATVGERVVQLHNCTELGPPACGAKFLLVEELEAHRRLHPAPEQRRAS